MGLIGKTAVVTGGGRGIGRAYCERLAADGANVVVVDLEDPSDSVDTLSGPGAKLGLACDVSSPEQVAELGQTVCERFGRCDILVNNAGIYPHMRIDDATLDVWRRVQAVNVEAVLLTVQAFLPAMREAGWGRIINTGSNITLMTQTVDLLAYITSKGAVHALTRALANELGDTGITANVIAPSIVPTEGLLGRSRGSAGMTSEQEVAAVVAMQTIRRPSRPSDLAGALAYLASEDADFVTGQIIHVDGGITRSGA